MMAKKMPTFGYSQGDKNDKHSVKWGRATHETVINIDEGEPIASCKARFKHVTKKKK